MDSAWLLALFFERLVSCAIPQGFENKESFEQLLHHFYICESEALFQYCQSPNEPLSSKVIDSDADESYGDTQTPISLHWSKLSKLKRR